VVARLVVEHKRKIPSVKVGLIHAVDLLALLAKLINYRAR